MCLGRRSLFPFDRLRACLGSLGFGLMYYGARWYDVALGRFVQADTIIPEQTQGTQAWDRYAGMNNNPVRYNDPTGHIGEDCSDNPETCKNIPTQPKPPTCIDGGWCYPQYATWNRLRLGSPCTACHVTHWTGTIPTNGEIDPSLVEYYRSMDNFAVAFHGYALVYTGYVAGEAAWLTDPMSIIPPNYRQEIGDAFTSWSMETTSQDTVAYRYWSGSGDPIGRWLTTDPSMLPQEARRLLALPPNNSATTVTPIGIPRGTTIITGGVAPQPGFGAYATGGGFQIYVPDLSVLFSLFQ